MVCVHQSFVKDLDIAVLNFVKPKHLSIPQLCYEMEN